ncbi:hypothetical protein GCM10009830_03810 [Glycomyces endophyticus]|uniref:PIN domain-containing protein n=1 Tax=Glycomyces endophyticus TaxID=480996 RepID=A0ABN2FZ53_9ACTN
MAGTEPRGVLDTCAFIDFEFLDPKALPANVDVTAVTLAELHQGIAYAQDARERATRYERLNAAVNRFDPLPFTDEAAHRYGTLVALTIAHGRSPKPRKMDLMIGAIASIHELPLYTRNADDFKGLDSVLRVVEL